MLFLLLKLLEINCREKMSLKKQRNLVSFPEKILNTPLTLSILKGLIYARFRVETFLYLVNIQPNLKSHPPPPKLSGSAPDAMPQKFLNVSHHRRVCQIDVSLALIFAASGSKRFGPSILFIRPTEMKLHSAATQCSQ